MSETASTVALEVLPKEEDPEVIIIDREDQGAELQKDGDKDEEHTPEEAEMQPRAHGQSDQFQMEVIKSMPEIMQQQFQILQKQFIEMREQHIYQLNLIFR